MSKMKDRLHTGELYLPGDEEIMTEQTKHLDRLYDFNMTRPTEWDKRAAMLKEMFANFNLTLVDDTHIYVGDYTMFGPNVTIATAGHPILPELRQQGYQYNMPVRNGKIVG